MNPSFHEPARELPVLSQSDVAVVGGGTAGVMAAVGAARQGARVCLIERQGSVGGALAMGMIGHLGNRYLDAAGRPIVGGAPLELLERLVALGAMPYASVAEALQGGHSLFYRHEHAGQICLEMLQEAGVELWLHSPCAAAYPAPEGGYFLAVETKGGRVALQARQVVDTSGEADVAVACGAPVTSGAHRSWGLLFEMGLVDTAAYEAYLAATPLRPEWDGWLARQLDLTPTALEQDPYWGEWRQGGRRAWPFQEAIMRAVEAGDLALFSDLPAGGQIRYGWDGFWPEPWHGPGTVTANVCMVTGLNPSDPRAATQAEVAARQYAYRFLAFLRRYVPGFERAVIRTMGAQTMPRGGREIVGEIMPGFVPYAELSTRDDVVCLGGGSDALGLPLGMFVPRDTPDLLVAGKCAAHGYSVRASVTCMAAGYSCGLLAALAAQQDCTPLDLEPGVRRAALLAHGVMLTPGPPEPAGWHMGWPDLPGVPDWDADAGEKRAKKLS